MLCPGHEPHQLEEEEDRDGLADRDSLASIPVTIFVNWTMVCRTNYVVFSVLMIA